MVDREVILTHYRRMPIESLRHFAQHDVWGLEPETVELLRLVLHERGAVEDPDAVLDIQRNPPSPPEFEVMLQRFRQLPCPSCGGTGTPLNAAWVSRAGGRDRLAGCVPCLRKELERAQTRSFGAGLLGPGAAANSVRTMSENQAMLAALEPGTPTAALREYVWYNRGEFTRLRP